MTLRQLKFVDIRLTGTPETRSTSSINRKVSSVKLIKSKRFAVRFVQIVNECQRDISGSVQHC